MRPKSFTTAEIRELIGELELFEMAAFDPRPKATAHRAKAALEYLLQFVEWRDIKNPPPNDSRLVIFWNGMPHRARADDWHHKALYLEGVTHWREDLPPPPQEHKQGTVDDVSLPKLSEPAPWNAERYAQRFDEET